MRVLWICFALASFSWMSVLPALCQEDEDFTRHNRFKMGKQYWAKDPDHLPRVRDPQHSVRTGEVVTHGQSIDPSLLAKPAPLFAPSTTSIFGQPRSVAPISLLQSSMPLPIVSVRPEPALAVKPALPRHAFDQELAPPNKSAEHIITRRKLTKALLVAHQPTPLKATSYPTNTGYTHADPPPIRASHDSAEIKVHAKLLPLH